MDIRAEQKYLLMSPRKIRPVADVAKRLKPVDAVARLPFLGKKAVEPLLKVIKQAIANARNKGISEGDLIFKEIVIGEGPRLKRGRPISRGQWHPIKKRMSHIRVVLTQVKAQEPKVKGEEKVEEKKVVKKGKGK